jgi:hypothetical protein
MQRHTLPPAVLAGVLAAALGSPAAASAGEPGATTAVKLEASANLDAARAANVAGRSRSAARKLVASSRTKLERAYRQTVATSDSTKASATQTFNGALDRNDAALRRLAAGSSGSLAVAAAAALDSNADMRGRVALELVADMKDRPADPGVRDALTAALEGERRTSAMLTQLYGRAKGQARTIVAGAVRRVAASSRRIASALSASRDGNGGGGEQSQSLVGLSLSVSVQANGNATMLEKASRR